jgi:hypothetical protein
VVHLVLDHPSLEARRLHEQRLTVPVAGPHAHVDRALDVDVDAREAEAPLLHPLLVVAGPLDDRVDERLHGALVLDAVDQQPRQPAELRGGQPDAQRVAHEAAHPRDLGPQRVVEDVHLARPRAQDGVAVLDDVRERALAPRGDLGIEGLGRLLVRGDLGIERLGRLRVGGHLGVRLGVGHGGPA